MTIEEKLIKNKLGLLRLAEEYANTAVYGGHPRGAEVV